MITPEPIHPYKHYRFGEIISRGVWLYDHFSLSNCDVEELLFGQAYAQALGRRRPRPGDKWHLDEVCITLNARRIYGNVYGQENLEALLYYRPRSYDTTLTRCLGTL